MSPLRPTLPPAARVRSKSDFDRIFKRGVRASDGWITLLAAHNDRPLARLGISVSRRFGNAVRRNRVKRLIREAFRSLRHELPPGTDWVVIPRAGRKDEPTVLMLQDSIRRLSTRLANRLAPLNPTSQAAAKDKKDSSSPPAD